MKAAVRTATEPLFRVIAPRHSHRRVSAMIRVRNEAQFLDVVVESVASTFDQIVIIDNLSSDATLEIATQLANQYPNTVKVVRYPFRVRRPGSESEQGRAHLGDSRSLATFYNWCVRQCDHPYIAKWDGDMIATPEFEKAIAAFRVSQRQQSLWFTGVNVHPCMSRLLANRDGFRSHEDFEARVFPRRFAWHHMGEKRYESLRTPFKHGNFGLWWERPAYIHLKYCKVNLLQNWSDEVRGSIDGRKLPLGEPLDDETRSTLRAHRLEQLVTEHRAIDEPGGGEA